MPNRPNLDRASPDVVIIDSSSPRAASHASDVIVVDTPPRPSRPSSAVDELPRKRRRCDQAPTSPLSAAPSHTPSRTPSPSAVPPTSMPPPTSSDTPDASIPVIVVDDDDSPEPAPPLRSRIRRWHVCHQPDEDVIVTSAVGPRIVSRPSPLSPPPSRAGRNHVSMPSLLHFVDSGTLPPSASRARGANYPRMTTAPSAAPNSTAGVPPRGTTSPTIISPDFARDSLPPSPPSPDMTPPSIITPTVNVRPAGANRLLPHAGPSSQQFPPLRRQAANSPIEIEPVSLAPLYGLTDSFDPRYNELSPRAQATVHLLRTIERHGTSPSNATTRDEPSSRPQASSAQASLTAAPRGSASSTLPGAGSSHVRMSAGQGATANSASPPIPLDEIITISPSPPRASNNDASSAAHQPLAVRSPPIPHFPSFSDNIVPTDSAGIQAPLRSSRRYRPAYTLPRLPMRSSQASASGPSLPQPSLPLMSLPQASLLQASLPQASLPQASLPQASLPQASLPQASLPQASLPQASLSQASVPQQALTPPLSPFPPYRTESAPSVEQANANGSGSSAAYIATRHARSSFAAAAAAAAMAAASAAAGLAASHLSPNSNPATSQAGTASASNAVPFTLQAHMASSMPSGSTVVRPRSRSELRAAIHSSSTLRATTSTARSRLPSVRSRVHTTTSSTSTSIRIRRPVPGDAAREIAARSRRGRLNNVPHRLRLLMVQGGQVGVGVTPAMEIQYHMSRAGDLDYEQLIRLDEQLIRERNRAKKSQIDALPIVKAGKEDKEIRCCVCMCDVEEGEELRVLPCSHKYHMSCIDKWLTYNGCCPVDKKRISGQAGSS